MFKLIRLYPAEAKFSLSDLTNYGERMRSIGRGLGALKERFEAVEDLVEIERLLYLESQPLMMGCCLAYV